MQTPHVTRHTSHVTRRCTSCSFRLTPIVSPVVVTVMRRLLATVAVPAKANLVQGNKKTVLIETNLP